jgi:15-cis-phytoene synthase
MHMSSIAVHALILTDQELSESFAVCRELTRRHARSFYFASHALPSSKRKAAYAIYAFCRHMDDTIDLAPDAAAKMKGLAELRELVDEAFSGELSDAQARLKWLPAFMQTAANYQVPKSLFLDLLAGVEMDLGPVRMQNWQELRQYCYHVAGVVGLMMAPVLSDTSEKLQTAALDLGIAMQLTNILRDIGEDWKQNRVYLPEQEMTAYGVSTEDIAADRTSESFRGLMRFQIGRAREYYQRSEAGIRALPRDGSQMTVWQMRTIYAGILDEIERADCQVFRGRHFVSTPRKLMLALKAWKLHWQAGNNGA